MKRYEIFFGILKIPLDFLIIFGVFFLSRDIRNVSDLIPGVILPYQTIHNEILFQFALSGAFLYIIILGSHRLYSLKISNSKVKEILDIFRYSLYWFIFYSAFIYFAKDFLFTFDIPRLIIGFTFIIGSILIVFERILLNIILAHLLNKGILEKRKMLLITNKGEDKISDILEDIEKSNIYKIVGYINPVEIKNLHIPYLFSQNDIKLLFEKNKIDEILYIDSDFDNKELFNIWDYAKIYGLRYRYITNSFDVTKTNTIVTLLNKIPVMEIKNTPLDAGGRVIKRIFDIFFSIIFLILSLPILIIVGIMIKKEDPDGPVFYKNRRVGQNGKIFDMYKLRYLKWKYCIKDAYGLGEIEDEALEYEKKLIEEKSMRRGPLYKIKDDPRMMKIGKVIEKYSIDEIPNLINVIIGHMSLVGPRPHQPREVEKYLDHEKRVLTIKPGISGMAQVNGRQNNDFAEEVKLDLFYVENRSILLDLKILFKTLGAIKKN